MKAMEDRWRGDARVREHLPHGGQRAPLGSGLA